MALPLAHKNETHHSEYPRTPSGEFFYSLQSLKYHKQTLDIAVFICYNSFVVFGEVAEWSKAQHWKCCEVQASVSSNLILSSMSEQALYCLLCFFDEITFNIN